MNTCAEKVKDYPRDKSLHIYVILFQQTTKRETVVATDFSTS